MPKQFGFAALAAIFLVVEKAHHYSWAFSIFDFDFESGFILKDLPSLQPLKTALTIQTQSLNQPHPATAL